MKSFEFSHKNRDLDQRDPEHLAKETAEFSWDDLKNVPFMGNHGEQQIENTLDEMEDVGSFGRNARTKENTSQANKDEDIDKNLSDISSTF